MTDRVGTSKTPTLAEVISSAIAKAQSGIFKALPGKVESYDSTKQTASIKPLVKIPVVFDDGSEGLDVLPVISGVPVVFPRGGGYYLSFPLQKGDNVLLVFCDRAIDQFVASAGSVDTDPQDLRMHDLSDAVALPGFYPVAKAVKDDLSTEFRMGADGGAYISINSAGQINLNGHLTVDR